jgi:nitrous oxide reductase accessory protein NosL
MANIKTSMNDRSRVRECVRDWQSSQDADTGPLTAWQQPQEHEYLDGQVGFFGIPDGIIPILAAQGIPFEVLPG